MTGKMRRPFRFLNDRKRRFKPSTKSLASGIALLTVILALLLGPSASSACSCARLTGCEAFNYAEAVFVGRVIDGEVKEREYQKDGKTFEFYSGKVRLVVEETFKGIDTTETTIYVENWKGTSCAGNELLKGATYLVYAGTSPGSGLTIGPCSGTKSVAGASSDLQFLRHLPKVGSGGRLFGTVGVEKGSGDPKPLPGVKIVVKDQANREYQATTNSQGNYEFRGLKPGEYLVNPILSDEYFIYPQALNRQVRLSDRGCAEESFWIYAEGAISGRVTDVDGRAASAEITLISVGPQKRTSHGTTDENGEYEIWGIAPGQYRLYLTLFHGRKETPLYYPNSKKERSAEIIEIGLAKQRSGYDFRLPLQAVVIEGTVMYSDGQPASNATVQLSPERDSTALRANEWSTETTTDSDGRFRISGYKDVIYEIIVRDDQARAMEQGRYTAGMTGKVNLVFTDDTSNVDLAVKVFSASHSQKEKQKSLLATDYPLVQRGVQRLTDLLSMASPYPVLGPYFRPVKLFAGLELRLDIVIAMVCLTAALRSRLNGSRNA